MLLCLHVLAAGAPSGNPYDPKALRAAASLRLDAQVGEDDPLGKPLGLAGVPGQSQGDEDHGQERASDGEASGDARRQSAHDKPRAPREFGVEPETVAGAAAV